MDLIKIGKYIAGKRKGLGLTQSQLAEKLSKSDKSVSKWERGICLPDVSVYLELCDTLGISLNEFLAGEDISGENIERRSEDTLLQVTKDSEHKQRSLKGVIAVLLVITVVAAAVLGVFLCRYLSRPRNYISVLAPDSIEMKTAELLSGVEGALLFKYYNVEEIRTLTVYISEYRRGELTAKEPAANFTRDEPGPMPEGMIALVPDSRESKIKLIVTNESAKYSADIPILDDPESGDWLARADARIEEDTPIQYDREQWLAAFLYDGDGVTEFSPQELENGEVSTTAEYVYSFSVAFER
ncbi:MAG: helix-turn-helix transcriptional regulator [Acutalibacter sp.]|nr:helix-turn-helix transcriptional regulator [Acutalibacter sp.]